MQSSPSSPSLLPIVPAQRPDPSLEEIKRMGRELVTLTKAATEDNYNAFRAISNSLQAAQNYLNLRQACLIADQQIFLTQYAATHPNFYNGGPVQMFMIIPAKMQTIIFPQHQLLVDCYEEVQNLATDLPGNDILQDLALSVYNVAIDVRDKLRNAIGNYNLLRTNPISEAISKARQVIARLESFVNNHQSFTDESSNSPDAVDMPAEDPQ